MKKHKSWIVRTYTRQENIAFNRHRGDAKKRGIGFHFTFEEWLAWWKKRLGPDWMKWRGCRVGQYVMARYNDEGDYIEGNVRCITSSHNHAEFNIRTKRKPPKKKRR